MEISKFATLIKLFAEDAIYSSGEDCPITELELLDNGDIVVSATGSNGYTFCRLYEGTSNDRK